MAADKPCPQLQPSLGYKLTLFGPRGVEYDPILLLAPIFLEDTASLTAMLVHSFILILNSYVIKTPSVPALHISMLVV